MGGLIDQHHRDVVFDGIHEPTRFADEPVVGLVEMDITLALWTGKNIQEILANCHFVTSLKQPCEIFLSIGEKPTTLACHNATALKWNEGIPSPSIRPLRLHRIPVHKRALIHGMF